MEGGQIKLSKSTTTKATEPSLFTTRRRVVFFFDIHRLLNYQDLDFTYLFIFFPTIDSVLFVNLPPHFQIPVAGVDIFSSRNGAHYSSHSQFEHHIFLAAVVGPGMVVKRNLIKIWYVGDLPKSFKT